MLVLGDVVNVDGVGASAHCPVLAVAQGNQAIVEGSILAPPDNHLAAVGDEGIKGGALGVVEAAGRGFHVRV